MITATEQTVLEQALQAVRDETGLQFTVKKTADNDNVDTLLKMKQGNIVLAGEIKKWAPQANLGVLINQVKNLPAPGVLIADYVNPKMAEKLRQEKVQFIDTFGNAFINVPPTYVYVAGKRQQTVNEFTTATLETNRAFEATGLKVIYTFLCQPEFVNAPYREIAQKAGVAVGTVGWVIKGLKELGFIRSKGTQTSRRLANVEKLVTRWVEAYSQKLKPKQWVGEFIAEDPMWWKTADIKKYAGWWGAEIAAAKITTYLKPQVATVYLPNTSVTNFLGALRLRKARTDNQNKAGTVQILNAFWQPEDNKNEVVDPLLAYADLVATGDTRNIEVARRIYDEHITRLIRQD